MSSSKVVEGEGGQQKVVLQHASGATAEVYLWGATLTSYKAPSGKESIFVSPAAIFDGKKAIRGGVPLVFPQFGQPDKAMPQHGIARINMWELGACTDTGDAMTATFTLQDNEDTRAKWPHAFQLEYVVELTEQALTMRLRITNSGDEPFAFHALLHTYFAVPDIADVLVEGLKGRSFEDKVAGGEPQEEAREQVDVPSYTDRIYLASEPGAKEVSILSKGTALYKSVNSATPNLGGRAHEDASSPCDVVLWNPFPEASPGDLPPPAFRGFVCVEPGLVGKFQDLAPKAAMELCQTIVPL